MRITIAAQHHPVAERFQDRNPAIPCRASASGRGATLEIPDAALSPQARQQIRLHFSYLDLFEWQGPSIEDVRFWERVARFSDIARDFAALTADLGYDLLAPIEARGVHDPDPGVRAAAGAAKGEDDRQRTTDHASPSTGHAPRPTHHAPD